MMICWLQNINIMLNCNELKLLRVYYVNWVTGHIGHRDISDQA